MLIDLGDIRLNVVDEGPDDGPGSTLLLLHGLGANHRVWQAQLDGLRGDFRCVAPDLRNSGQSDVTAGPCTLEQLADDVARLCARIGVERAVVIGQSMGGMVAQALAVHHPGLVEALVLVGTARDGREGPGPSTELSAVEGAARAGGLAAVPPLVVDAIFPPAFREARPEQVWRFERELLSFDLDGLMTLLNRRVETDYAAALPGVRVPTLILAGRHDQVCQPEESDHLAELLPHAELLVWEESGHQPFVEEPERFDALVRRFVAESVATPSDASTARA